MAHSRNLLSDAPHHPRKRFGQHFLADRAVLARIVKAFAPRAGEPVLEIGAGTGALTDALVAAGGGADFSLRVVEIDRDLARRLREKYERGRNSVTVIEGDILDINLRDLLADNRARLRLIGNLPYNISTPLIFHLLAQAQHIHDMLFMVQREVALRLCAPPGGKNRGRLSVMTAMALDCAMLFDVPPDAFVPPPKVVSTVVRLTPKKHPPTVRDRATFDAVVAAAFSHRRKTLRNALAAIAQPKHFTTAKVDPSLRAETLPVESFIALADAIAE